MTAFTLTSPDIADGSTIAQSFEFDGFGSQRVGFGNARAALFLPRGKQVQRHAVARLQVDHQAVGCAQRRAVDGVGRGAEVDGDVCLARGQALAGADVERHARPAPIGDLGAQGDEGFGGAAGRHAVLVGIGAHALAGRGAGGILAAHHVPQQRGGCPRTQRTQHLELLIADGIGMGVDGRLHGDRAQQLQRVVLHHVAQRAGLVVEGATLLHAQLLGHGDLDAGHGLAPPQGFEQRVAKAQRQQVLYRGLAQVVVDAEDLPFVEHAAHRGVDGTVGSQIVPQGLFQHHAGGGRRQAGSAELLADGGEQRGRGGQVHHHRVGMALAQAPRQQGVILWLGQIHALVLQQRGKAFEFFVAGAFFSLHIGKAPGNQRAVIAVAQRVARHADDAPLRRQRPVAKSLEQGRQQLAPGEVARAAEEDQIKAHEPAAVMCRGLIDGKTVPACGPYPVHDVIEFHGRH